MRSNNTFIFLVVAIVSFLVYWFFIRKKTVKTPAPTPSSTETPSATMGEAVVTFKPDKDADEPEAYTEYADDTSWAELSGNVTVKLTWDNKAGFNNTTKITIRREIVVDDEDEGTTYDHVIERYNTDGTVITANGDYFKNFQDGLTYTVTNKSGNNGDAYSVLGKNTYSILYTLTDGRSEILTEDEGGNKETLTDTFSIEDLSLTLDAVAKTERRVKPSGAGGVETSSAVSENNVYLLSKNKRKWNLKDYARMAYGNYNYNFVTKKFDYYYLRLDKVLKQTCNKKKGYETTDKNAFRLYCNFKKKHVAVNFKYKTDGAFDKIELTCTDEADKINKNCIDGTFCTTFKMVQDQYTKGDTGDDTKYYAFRVSDCNRKTKTSWASMTDAQKEDPDNTRGTGDLKSTVDAYLVTNPANGELSVKTLDTMTDQELSEGWHAFEMRNVDSGTDAYMASDDIQMKKVCK